METMEKQGKLIEIQIVKEEEPVIKRFRNIFHVPGGLMVEEVIKISKLIKHSNQY